jgi:hypothetical protein
MAQLLISIAASIFLLMGAGHGALTLRDLKHPRAFTPQDPALRQAMQQSSIAFHPTINLWKAWLGFNLTHSLGLVPCQVRHLINILACRTLPVWQEQHNSSNYQTTNEVL